MWAPVALVTLVTPVTLVTAGTIMWALQRKGVMHATVVAFASDHGNIDKGHCYMQGTQTPLLLQVRTV